MIDEHSPLGQFISRLEPAARARWGDRFDAKVHAIARGLERCGADHLAVVSRYTLSSDTALQLADIYAKVGDGSLGRVSPETVAILVEDLCDLRSEYYTPRSNDAEDYQAHQQAKAAVTRLMDLVHGDARHEVAIHGEHSALAEKSVIPDAQATPAPTSAEDIKTLMLEPAYWNKADPDHKTVVEQVTKYFEQQSPPDEA